MLSLVYIVLAIAAGSIASPCSPSASSSAPAPVNSAPATGNSTPATDEKAAVGPAPIILDTGSDGVGSTTGLLQFSGQAPTSNTTATLSASSVPSATATSGSIASGGGGASQSCPQGFINTVFNTGAPKTGGWPQTVWNSMTSNGISDWIGFSLGTLDTKPDYSGPLGPAVMTPTMNSAQIHVVMDPRDTDEAMTMLQSGSPPAYLELFNEPDFSFENLTMLTDAQTAAQNLSQLFDISHPLTTFISPALMNANGDWLTTFKDSCNNCFDQIPIVALHVYNPDPSGVMAQITQLHGTWPDKKIWITELSPATTNCTLINTGTGPGTMADYIGTLIPQILALGYVEKIFWNSGEWNSGPINGAPAACNPSLVDANGNPTDVLSALGKVCGISGGTATSRRRGFNFGKM